MKLIINNIKYFKKIMKYILIDFNLINVKLIINIVKLF